MEIMAIIVAVILGWQHAALGKHEWQIIALVVAGWTAVSTAASVPYLALGSFLFDLFYHTVVVTVPYTAAALARRVSERGR
jgi:hypothetical protein